MDVVRLKQKGFTLVELLVVISIIALLMSVIMPSLQKAREQARKVVCAARLSQLGKSFITYAANNREKLPTVHISATDPGGDEYAAWASYDFGRGGALCKEEYGFYPAYIADKNFFYCPTLIAKYPQWRPDASAWGYTNWPRNIGYYVLFNRPWVNQRAFGKTINRFSDIGGNFPLACDYAFGRSDVRELGVYGHLNKRNYSYEGGNRMYSDGSVNWAKFPSEIGFGELPVDNPDWMAVTYINPIAEYYIPKPKGKLR